MPLSSCCCTASGTSRCWKAARCAAWSACATWPPPGSSGPSSGAESLPLRPASGRVGVAVGVGVASGLGAVTRACRGEDAVDVGLDRRLADEQGAGDLPVGLAGRDEAQHLGLARRQLVVGTG